MSNLVLIKNKK